MKTNGNGTKPQRARIIGLQAKNFKRLVELSINDLGDIVEVRGDAGQGKTSILDAIRAAIEGADPSMIHNGADACELVLDTNLAKINRIIHRDGSRDYLAVSGPDGKRVAKAAEFLKAIFGPQAFSPLQWVQLGGGDARGRTERLRRQRDELLNAMPVQLTVEQIIGAVEDLGPECKAALERVDLDQVDLTQHALVVCREAERACYEYRKGLNQTVADAEARLSAHPAPEAMPPDQSAEALALAMRQAQEAFYQAKGRAGSQQATRDRAAKLRERIERESAVLPNRAELETRAAAALETRDRLNAEIVAMQERLTELRRQHERSRLEVIEWAETERALDALDDARAELSEIENQPGMEMVEDLEALQAMAIAAERRLMLRTQQDAYDASAAEAAQARDQAERYDALVKLFRDELPRQVIERMEMPIDGLGIDGELVTLRGVPIHQLGTSEQYLVATKIFSCLNPNVGFMPIDGAESLGRADRLALAEAAAETGLQLILTYVDPDAEPGAGRIVMRDGKVVE